MDVPEGFGIRRSFHTYGRDMGYRYNILFYGCAGTFIRRYRLQRRAEKLTISKNYRYSPGFTCLLFILTNIDLMLEVDETFAAGKPYPHRQICQTRRRIKRMRTQMLTLNIINNLFGVADD